MIHPVYNFVNAESTHDFSAAASLFREYAGTLNFDLHFQQFDKELNELDRQYSLPSGRLILIQHDGGFVGCAGIRQFEPAIAELKRMYIQPAHRGRGLGGSLMATAIEQAIALGYKKIRLDTLKTMTNAIRVYRHFGFVETTPYRFNPHEEVLYFEKDL